MKPDVSIVLYRPDAMAFAQILQMWSGLEDEVRRVRILISGAAASERSLMPPPSLTPSMFDLVFRHDNIGFASGHNLLLERAFASDAPSVLVANPDLAIAPEGISRLVATSVADGATALYAPLLERLDEDYRPTGTVDSAGIFWDRYGRHFDYLQGSPVPPLDLAVHSRLGVTGACMLVTARAHRLVVRRTTYFFDDTFLAYREDAELGIRAKLVDVDSRVVYLSGFGHVRTVRGFTRGNRLADLLGVKNRFLIKYALGRHRPGLWPLPFLRDALVFVGAAVRERSSLPGLREARRIRGFVVARGRRARDSGRTRL
ncbi:MULTISPECIES: hypothetical protein [unclassified Microbacterium]|uniref:hypothetical protein n=1 Tax=unclassified Microbacterium TaxID=2609290 RepID=UPI00386E6F42